MQCDFAYGWQVLICYSQCLCEVKLLFYLSYFSLPFIEFSIFIFLYTSDRIELFLHFIVGLIGSKIRKTKWIVILYTLPDPPRPIRWIVRAYISSYTFIASANKYQTHTHIQTTCIHLFTFQNGAIYCNPWCLFD